MTKNWGGDVVPDPHQLNRNLARLSGKIVIRKVMSGMFFGHIAWFLYLPNGGQYELVSHMYAVSAARTYIARKKKDK